MSAFILGALAMGYLTAGMFFARFYVQTRDRFFAFMCAAFAIMSANQLALLLFGEDSEHRSILFLARLLAFVLILVGIIDKNRS